MNNFESIRITNIVIDNNTGNIFAADDKGLLRKLSPELDLIKSSISTKFSAYIGAIDQDDQYIYTRDIQGKIVKWNKLTLQPEVMLLTDNLCSERYLDTTPNYSPSQTMHSFEDHIYTSNAYGEIIKLSKKNLECEKIYNHQEFTMMERINHKDSENFYATDVRGQVWWFNDSKIKKLREPTEYSSTAHCIIYDKKNERLWYTDDNQGGVTIINTEGQHERDLLFTIDDVEEIAFSMDYEYVYIACFDHYLYLYENKKIPVLNRKIGPFKFQLNHVKVHKNNNIYITLESGEIFCLDANTHEIIYSAFGTNAIWSLDNLHTDKGSIIMAGTESGSLLLLKPDFKNNIINFSLENHKKINNSRLRRAIQIDDNKIACISSNGELQILSSIDNSIISSIKLQGILRDICVLDDRNILICSESGHLYKYNHVIEAIEQEIQFKNPLWCICYDGLKYIVLGTRSLNSTGSLLFLDRKSLDVVEKIEIRGNPKRIRKLKDGLVLIVGNGQFNIRILDTISLNFQTILNEWVSNTVENAIVLSKKIYAITYGQQLLSYSLEDNTIQSVQFNIESYPKGLALYHNNKSDYLFIGGREFLSVFKVSDDYDPILIKTIFLPLEL